jgi:nitrate/TMAO reductase-like tetraheme cytochrome c subunit
MTAAVVGGVMWFIPYSESVSFCTTCHTMIPQHKAFDASGHADVACGECHVAPGIQGWISAKMAGTQELKALILNNYPTPIPPIPHEDMPSTKVTCQKCHSLDRINQPGNPIKLILRPRYETDEANTMQMVAVAIRPTGLGSTRNAEASSGTVETSSGAAKVLDPRGVHWHVASTVNVYATDEQRQNFPLIEYTTSDGSVETFINAAEIGLASNVTPDIERLKGRTQEHVMDCIDCHNMVGHNIPEPARSLDTALSEGVISPTLPFIKRDALTVLNRSYRSEEAGNQAIDAFAAIYASEHPDVAQKDPEALASATDEVRRIYNETSTPAMKTVWDSYPDNLGHQRSPGCFRCHDGAHVKVVDGVATDETIPSTCSTCHTFPQVGASITGLQMGVPPASHSEKLFVFTHKTSVPSVDAAFEPTPPAGADCATCHQKSYCENCHNSGASKITHDEMLFNHAQSVQLSSVTACAYCHQPVYCATCHTGDIVSRMQLGQVRLNTQGDVVNTPDEDATTQDDGTG